MSLRPREEEGPAGPGRVASTDAVSGVVAWRPERGPLPICCPLVSLPRSPPFLAKGAEDVDEVSTPGREAKDAVDVPKEAEYEAEHTRWGLETTGSAPAFPPASDTSARAEPPDPEETTEDPGGTPKCEEAGDAKDSPPWRDEVSGRDWTEQTWG